MEQIQMQSLRQQIQNTQTNLSHSDVHISSSKSFINSFKALFIKSMQVQSRNYCANICQVISPLLCLLFTLVVRIVVQGITTGAVQNYNFPQPFNFPILNKLIKPSLNLTCQQIYYYEIANKPNSTFSLILQKQFRQYCFQSKQQNPKFIRKNKVNQAIMECVKKADQTAFQRGDDLQVEIPDGSLRIKDVNQQHLNAVLSINDFRLPQYHKNNGVTKILIKTSQTSVIGTYLRVTQGMMSLIDKLTRPFLQTYSSQKLFGSFMYMPFSGSDTAFVNKLTNILGSGLYPLGMALMMPLLLYMVVSQKQQKQIQIMKMNGLNPKIYWFNFFVVSIFLSLLSSFLMFVFGVYIVDIAYFKLTSWLILWSVFVGWAIAQASLTSFVQIFIDSARTSTIVGYLLSIFSCLIGMVLSTVIFPSPYKLPFVLILFPPFALSRIIFHLGMGCAGSDQCYKSFSQLDLQASICICILYLWIFVFFLSIYLSQLIQQQYGSAQKIQWLNKLLNKFKKNKKNTLIQQNGSNFQNQLQMKDTSFALDESIIKYQESLKNKQRTGQEPLYIQQITKFYNYYNQNSKFALNSFNLQLKKGQIFGLLGPNGAGKTTLISVLTGMYPPSSGAAWIGGREIGNYFANQLIGVCPQFDILWNDLTVEQHLWFYCRMKNVLQKQVSQRVNNLLLQVDLSNQKAVKSSALSGGMKRRLSIACALAGNPSIIILDEPSSGLDPFHRRQVWDILKKVKNRTSILLTSHIMQQVQVLCDRIAIINQGKTRCIGKTRQLKEKFGKGYRLTLSYSSFLKLQDVKRPEIIQFFINKLKLQIVNEFQTMMVMKLRKEDMVKVINILKKQKQIDWMINQPSLHDLFMKFS